LEDISGSQSLPAGFVLRAKIVLLLADGGFFKVDEHEFNEQIFWVDPNFFEVFRFPVVAGNLRGALDNPDTLVLTRRQAEKYFGRPDPLGETLVLDGKHAMTVTAVIEDLPSNTHFEMDVLAAGVSAHSPIADQDLIPMTVVGAKPWAFRTYGRLKRGESIAPLRESIRTLPDRHSERAAGGQAASEVWPLIVRPIRTIHLSARDVASPDNESLGRLYGAIGIGALIILAAAINFVTLRTALAMRRAVEVGVRKACGGNRRALFAQFMSEVFVHVFVATALGVALATAALPALNAFLLRTIEWQTLFSPVLLGGIAALLVAVTVLAGSYPAFVLASFRPSVVTKARSSGQLQNGVRQGLVALQFAIVIAVLIATIVVHRQTAFGMRESLRQISDPIVLLRTSCSDAIKDAMARLPGVKGAACAAYPPQAGGGGVGPVQYNGSERLVLGEISIDFGFFELFGIELAAGRYFAEDFGADKTPEDAVWTTPESIVLNEAGIKKLGIASPQAAIGEIVTIKSARLCAGRVSCA
jgi:putative ABC transport system permease protein